MESELKWQTCSGTVPRKFSGFFIERVKVNYNSACREGSAYVIGFMTSLPGQNGNIGCNESMT